MSTKDRLNEKLKDHLLTIYQICSENRVARAKEISARLQVRPYAVTAALRALGGLALINYAPYDVITLTESGHRRAEKILRRRDALANFLVLVLDVERDEAEQAAAQLEQHMPSAILEKMIRFPHSDHHD